MMMRWCSESHNSLPVRLSWPCPALNSKEIRSTAAELIINILRCETSEWPGGCYFQISQNTQDGHGKPAGCPATPHQRQQRPHCSSAATIAGRHEFLPVPAVDLSAAAAPGQSDGLLLLHGSLRQLRSWRVQWGLRPDPGTAAAPGGGRDQPDQRQRGQEGVQQSLQHSDLSPGPPGSLPASPTLHTHRARLPLHTLHQRRPGPRLPDQIPAAPLSHRGNVQRYQVKLVMAP